MSRVLLPKLKLTVGLTSFMRDKTLCVGKVVRSYLLLPGELAQKWRSAPDYNYFFLNKSQRDTVHKDLLFFDWRPRVKYSFLYHPSSILWKKHGGQIWSRATSFTNLYYYFF
jgi:hypothetical protein